MYKLTVFNLNRTMYLHMLYVRYSNKNITYFLWYLNYKYEFSYKRTFLSDKENTKNVYKTPEK